MEWIDCSKELPDYDEDVKISYDGGKTSENAAYLERRTCMLAGSAGGHGYFGEGFATDGYEGCSRGLILDDPTHWKPID